MEIEFVCLANSRLQDGRSVAGLRTDGGGWVRIVGPNGPLAKKHYTMEGGRETEILDVVKAETLGSRPVNHQPENYVASGPRGGFLGPNLDSIFGFPRWKPAGHVELANAPGILDPLIRKGPDLFGPQRDREELSAFDGRPAMTSLTMIEPNSPTWEITSAFRGQRAERQVRARFTLDGAEYSLPVSDPRWEERCSPLDYGNYDNEHILVGEEDRLLLTVSLDEPFYGNNPSGECYKSIVGVIHLRGAKASK